jgi:hypothetical protein
MRAIFDLVLSLSKDETLTRPRFIPL